MKSKKVCSKCLKKKSFDEFYPRKNGSPGSYCFHCRIGYYREYNAKRYASREARDAESARGVEKYHSQIKPARIERKRQLVMMLGGKCALCGYDRNMAALDFDHVEKSGHFKRYHRDKNPRKRRTMSHLLAINQPWAFDAAKEEAKRCRLICSNCHRELTYPGYELNCHPKNLVEIEF
jgi:hypothetical protein